MANDQPNAGASKQGNNYVQNMAFQTTIQTVDTLLNQLSDKVIYSGYQLRSFQGIKNSYIEEWKAVLECRGPSHDPNHSKEMFLRVLEWRLERERCMENTKQKLKDLEEDIRHFLLPSAEEVFRLREKVKVQEETIKSLQPSTEFVKDALVFKNLSWNLQEQDARRLISSDLNLPYPRAWNYHKDKNTNTFTGISFANYETEEQARQVFEFFNNSNHIIEERVVKVEYKIEKPAAEGGNSRRENSTLQSRLPLHTGEYVAGQDLGSLDFNTYMAGSTHINPKIYELSTRLQPLPTPIGREQGITRKQNTAPQDALYSTPEQTNNIKRIQGPAIPALSTNQTYDQHVLQQQRDNSNITAVQSGSTFARAANPFAKSSTFNQGIILFHQKQSQGNGFQQTKNGDMSQIYPLIPNEAYWCGRSFTPLGPEDETLYSRRDSLSSNHQQANISNGGQTTPQQFSPIPSNPQSFCELNPNSDAVRNRPERTTSFMVNPPTMPRMPGNTMSLPHRNGNEAKDNSNARIFGQK